GPPNSRFCLYVYASIVFTAVGLSPSGQGRRGDASHGGHGRLLTSPHEPLPTVIPHLRVGKEEFRFEILQEIVLERELPLEGAIGHASPLAQQGHDLIEHFIQVHHTPSANSSSNAWASCRSLVSKPSVNQP